MIVQHSCPQRIPGLDRKMAWFGVGLHTVSGGREGFCAGEPEPPSFGLKATRGIWEFDVSSGGAAGLVTCCRPIGQLPAEGSPQAACLGPPPPRSRHTPGSFAANYPEGAVACCCSIFRQRQKLTLSRHLSMTISLRLNSGGLIPMDNFFAIHQFRLQFSSNYRERGC